MFKMIFIVFVVLIFIYCISNKIHIRFKTFLKRGFYVDRSPYGIYCYHSKQGSGKTMSAVSFLFQNTQYPIYANLKSIKGLKYFYFSGWNELMKIGTTKSNCIIFYDELFKGYYKGKKMKEKDKEILMDFMSQMRKRHIIFITTAQEWLEVPIEFRRYVRYDIECSLRSIFGYPILKKIFHNTELIKWDNLENEYVSPIISTYIEHGRKKIVNSYDTFEQISSEEIPYIEVFNKYSTDDYIIPENENKHEINTKLDNTNKKENYLLFVSDDTHQKQINNNNNKINKKNIIFYIKLFIKKIIKNVKSTTRFFTTTIKKRVVNCQFTNILHFKKDKKLKNKNKKNIVIDSVDNDFWEDFNNDDLQS